MILYSSISLPILPIPAAAAMEIVCLMNRPTSGQFRGTEVPSPHFFISSWSNIIFISYLPFPITFFMLCFANCYDKKRVAHSREAVNRFARVFESPNLKTETLPATLI